MTQYDFDTDSGKITCGPTPSARRQRHDAGIGFAYVDGNAVFIADSFDIPAGASWTVSGDTHPIVFFAATTISISGPLTAGGSFDDPGPGGTPGNDGSTTPGGWTGPSASGTAPASATAAAVRAAPTLGGDGPRHPNGVPLRLQMAVADFLQLPDHGQFAVHLARPAAKVLGTAVAKPALSPLELRCGRRPTLAAVPHQPRRGNLPRPCASTRSDSPAPTQPRRRAHSRAESR